MAACVPTPGEPDRPRPEAAGEDRTTTAREMFGICDAAPVQHYLGTEYASSMQADLLASTGSRSLRVLAPGDARSADYLSERLNVELDRTGRIRRITCG